MKTTEIHSLEFVTCQLIITIDSLLHSKNHSWPILNYDHHNPASINLHYLKEKDPINIGYDGYDEKNILIVTGRTTGHGRKPLNIEVKFIKFLKNPIWQIKQAKIYLSFQPDTYLTLHVGPLDQNEILSTNEISIDNINFPHQNVIIGDEVLDTIKELIGVFSKQNHKFTQSQS